MDFEPLWYWPKPAQQPYPPVLLGGESNYTLQRVVDYCEAILPLLAQYAAFLQSCPTIVASVLYRTHSADVHPLLWPARLTAAAARAAYERSGYGPQDVQLIELHDAFTIEELVYYEALGLVPEGESVTLLRHGSTALTGRIPVNSSEGLISMGHPLGPTGLGQIAEILWQMRRTAGPRQMPHDVHVALAHMIGAGGVRVIHILRQ